MARALDAVVTFCNQARVAGADQILVVGTSALREATNGSEFAERVGRATGREVRVVPGEDEARLTLLGALHGLPALSGTLLLFDIGGGSTEFVLASERKLRWVRSLALGVVALAERHRTAEPVDRVRYAELDREVRGQVARGLGDLLVGLRPDHLVGTAGSVTTLAALDQTLEVYDPAKVHGYRLARPRIEALLATLAALAADARAAMPGLEPGRADLIIPGIAICLAAMDTVGAESIIVSDFGLREGILLDYLSRPAH